MTELSPTLFHLSQVLSFEQSLLLTCHLTSCGKLGVAVIKGANGSVHLITISLQVKFSFLRSGAVSIKLWEKSSVKNNATIIESSPLLPINQTWTFYSYCQMWLIWIYRLDGQSCCFLEHTYLHTWKHAQYIKNLEWLCMYWTSTWFHGSTYAPKNSIIDRPPCK